jgi:hypothetical protein
MTTYTEAFESRFWKKVDASASCWVWTASTKGNGYGQVKHPDRKSPMFAHRVSYEMLTGEDLGDLTIDHLCKNTLCVNPDHLQPVDMKTNVLRSSSPTAINARKTHCPKGHELSEDNLVKQYGRRCKQCHRDRMRAVRVASHA